MLPNYVLVDDLDIISHVALQKRSRIYKSIPFTDEELLDMGAAPLSLEGSGYQATGKAVLKNGIYEIKYNAITPEELQRNRESALRETDDGFIRVMEDMLDLLVAKGLMQLTELPQHAQDKIQDRKDKRNAL